MNTLRQRVLALALLDKSNAEIASAVGTSAGTVSVYKAKLRALGDLPRRVPAKAIIPSARADAGSTGPQQPIASASDAGNANDAARHHPGEAHVLTHQRPDGAKPIAKKKESPAPTGCSSSANSTTCVSSLSTAGGDGSKTPSPPASFAMPLAERFAAYNRLRRRQGKPPVDMPEYQAMQERRAAHARQKAQGTGGKGCRWPLWGFYDRPSHEYCGHRVAGEGRPYCLIHAAVAYQVGTSNDDMRRARQARGEGA